MQRRPNAAKASVSTGQIGGARLGSNLGRQIVRGILGIHSPADADATATSNLSWTSPSRPGLVRQTRVHLRRAAACIDHPYSID